MVGVTGGLASGKSTLVAILAERGARVVSADAAGHAVLEEAAVRAELEQAFGRDVFGPDGRVDRARLGERAFASEEALARLNAISHPRLLARLRAELGLLPRQGFRGLVVLEAALLVEWDLGEWCDWVVAVVAPLEERLRRTATLGLSIEAARARISRQLPDAERVRYADRVLENRDDLPSFRRQAEALADELWDRWRSLTS